MDLMLALKSPKTVHQEDESDARTHRTPKALPAKFMEGFFHFAEAFGVRTRPRVALGAPSNCRNYTVTKWISRVPKPWRRKS